LRAFLSLTDAVEKVADDPSLSNNRIKAMELSNQCCVFAAVLESILLAEVPQNTFLRVSVMERQTRRNHFSSAALSIPDDLLRRQTAVEAE
jgi:hypothetical protein